MSSDPDAASDGEIDAASGRSYLRDLARDGPDGPPALPRALAHAPAFERHIWVDGFSLSPDGALLVPSFLATTHRRPRAVAADARLTGLGWTDDLELESGLATSRWAVDGRWAPPMLSARPSAVGLGGPVVADGPEGAAMSAPRGAWRAAGLLGGPLVRGRLGMALSLQATGMGLPAAEAGLAAGGRSRQSLALAGTWRPPGSDRLELLVLAGRRTDSPDCFRCTPAAARNARALGGLMGLSWTHAFAGNTALEIRVSAEHHQSGSEARSAPAGPSHLDLANWITDGAPGTLAPDLAASTFGARRTRLQLASRLGSSFGSHRVEGGVEARVETGSADASVPGGARFIDRGGPCTEEDTAGCAFRLEVEPSRVQVSGWGVAGHLQDVLPLGAGWTVRAGVRLELAQASAGETASGLRVGLGPRLALAWNVGEEGRHWLLAHAGRSHDAELHEVLTRSIQPVERVASWDGEAFASCSAPTPACIRLGGRAALAPGGLPHADHVAVGWRGAFGRGLQGGLEARWVQAAGLWTEQELALLTDEQGRWVSPEGTWSSRRMLSADPRAWRTELGLAAWARARAGPLRLSAAWSLSRISGTSAGPFDGWLADPRTAALAEGALPDDQRHRGWVSIAVLLHPAVELGARLRYASGGPLWETFTVHDSEGLRTVRTPRGAGLLADRLVALRDPDLMTADAWIRIRLGALVSHGFPRLDVTLEAAQLAGGNAPMHLSASQSRLGAVLRREPPFQLVLGLRAGD